MYFCRDKIYRKIITLIMFFILTFIISSLSVSATIIGANKAKINYKNVLKNGYSQELVTFTTDSDIPISVTYKSEGDISDWLSFDPPEQPFFMSKDAPYIITLIVQPPEDAKNEHYTGSVRFITGPLAGPGSQFGTAVRTAINIRLGVDITGQEIVSCDLSNFEIDDVEEGYPIELYAIVDNKGNVRIRPEITLEFWNQDQTELVQTFTFRPDEEIIPTVQKRIFYSFDHNLPIGQYWVKVKSMCGGSFLTMSVIERGGVSDKGELIEIKNNPWVKVNDIVPIDAVFKNFGSRVVSAKFKGTITSGDEIFKIIDTDSLDIAPGETINLRTYFNPVQEGPFITKNLLLKRVQY